MLPDPIGDFSRWLADVIQSIEANLQNAILKPEDMFGNTELSQIILSYSWPVGVVLILAALMGTLFAIGILIKSARKNLWHVVVAALIASVSMTGFWKLNQQVLLDAVRPTSTAILELWVDLAPANQTGLLFPDLGHDVGGAFGRVIFLIVVGIPFILAYAISYGQALVLGLLIITIGLWATKLASDGFLKQVITAWLFCYTVGMWLVALAYRLLQIVGNSSDNLFFTVPTQLILDALLVYLVYRIVKTVQKAVAKITNNLRSRVGGYVETFSQRRQKADVTVEKPVKTAPQQPPPTAPAASGGRTGPSRATQVRQGLEFGALVLAKQPVAAAAKAFEIAATKSPTQPVGTKIPVQRATAPSQGVRAMPKSAPSKNVVPRPQPRYIPARPKGGPK